MGKKNKFIELLKKFSWHIIYIAAFTAAYLADWIELFFIIYLAYVIFLAVNNIRRGIRQGENILRRIFDAVINTVETVILIPLTAKL